MAEYTCRVKKRHQQKDDHEQSSFKVVPDTNRESFHQKPLEMRYWLINSRQPLPSAEVTTLWVITCSCWATQWPSALSPPSPAHGLNTSVAAVQEEEALVLRRTNHDYTW